MKIISYPNMSSETVVSVIVGQGENGAGIRYLYCTMIGKIDDERTLGDICDAVKVKMLKKHEKRMRRLIKERNVERKKLELEAIDDRLVELKAKMIDQEKEFLIEKDEMIIQQKVELEKMEKRRQKQDRRSQRKLVAMESKLNESKLLLKKLQFEKIEAHAKHVEGTNYKGLIITIRKLIRKLYIEWQQKLEKVNFSHMRSLIQQLELNGLAALDTDLAVDKWMETRKEAIADIITTLNSLPSMFSELSEALTNPELQANNKPFRGDIEAELQKLNRCKRQIPCVKLNENMKKVIMRTNNYNSWY